jgi:uridylate kinase
MAKTIMLSLGGSVIAPDKVDAAFLKNFKKLVLGFVKRGYRFVVYCGGGSTARQYQKAASEAGEVAGEDLDWIGIHATKLNAHLLKALFRKDAEQTIVENPTKKICFRKKILICAGWKPGWSTDYDAVLMAKKLGISEIVNLTNTDYVYDKDPKKYKGAKPLGQLSWKEFRKVVGNKWTAGLNMPFDPIAAKEAEKSKIKVIVVGKDLGNLRKCLSRKEFKGTVVS